jgi:hypothetical protein
VVWQLPDVPQYFYVVTTTVSSDSATGGCAAATLAFLNPARETVVNDG